MFSSITSIAIVVSTLSPSSVAHTTDIVLTSTHCNNPDESAIYAYLPSIETLDSFPTSFLGWPFFIDINLSIVGDIDSEGTLCLKSLFNITVYKTPFSPATTIESLNRSNKAVPSKVALEKYAFLSLPSIK